MSVLVLAVFHDQDVPVTVAYVVSNSHGQDAIKFANENKNAFVSWKLFEQVESCYGFEPIQDIPHWQGNITDVVRIDVNCVDVTTQAIEYPYIISLGLNHGGNISAKEQYISECCEKGIISYNDYVAINEILLDIVVFGMSLFILVKSNGVASQIQLGNLSVKERKEIKMI